MAELYPICRSLTGDGVRSSLAILERTVPKDDRSRCPAVPRCSTGRFRANGTSERRGSKARTARGSSTSAIRPLHLLGYSAPVGRDHAIGRSCASHLFTAPRNPRCGSPTERRNRPSVGAWIRHGELERTPRGRCMTRGSTPPLEDEVTSRMAKRRPGELANEGPPDLHDDLSSLAGQRQPLRRRARGRLARIPADAALRYSPPVRSSSPGTIGPLSWLDRTRRASTGSATASSSRCVGDPGPAARTSGSRRHDAEVDHAVAHRAGRPGASGDRVSPYGGDERQFCSPGFDLAVGACRGRPPTQFPEYHTSADNLDLVQTGSARRLASTPARRSSTCSSANGRYLNLAEGRAAARPRGLYRTRRRPLRAPRRRIVLWILTSRTGAYSLLDISDRSGLAYPAVRNAAETLLEHGLLEKVEG